MNLMTPRDSYEHAVWGSGLGTVGAVLVGNRDFMGAGAQVYLGPQLTSASLVANRLRSGPQITNGSTGQVEVVGNVK